MKNISLKIWVITIMAGFLILPCSCTKDLLDQQPRSDLGANAFWKTEADATTALMGAYAAVRQCFDRDYYYDGHGEYVRNRSGTASTTSSNPYNGANYNPNGYGGAFDKMFRNLYGGIGRCNYVIENVEKMIADKTTTSPSSVSGLEIVAGEARLLRALCYFRLISMWGDVPYIDKIVGSNDEVAFISRSPIGEVKDNILADLTYAAEKLPDAPKQFGRHGKPAALALRGKVQLYWASWNNFGWPELEGFTPSPTEADNAYAAAVADFGSVINDFGLELFR